MGTSDSVRTALDRALDFIEALGLVTAARLAPLLAMVLVALMIYWLARRRFLAWKRKVRSAPARLLNNFVKAGGDASTSARAAANAATDRADAVLHKHVVPAAQRAAAAAHQRAQAGAARVAHAYEKSSPHFEHAANALAQMSKERADFIAGKIKNAAPVAQQAANNIADAAKASTQALRIKAHQLLDAAEAASERRKEGKQRKT